MPFATSPSDGEQRSSGRNRPAYREAFPRLSVGELWRETRQGRSDLIWRDRKDFPAGAASTVWVGRSRVDVHYMIEDRPDLRAARGDLSLTIVWKGSTGENARPFAACPVCQRSVDILIHTSRWACAACQKLGNRSALIAEEVRWAEEIEQLEDYLALSDLTGEATKRTGTARVRLELLQNRLGGRRVVANKRYLETVSTEWVLPDLAAVIAAG